MKKKQWKRLVSVTVALEMFLSPVTTAWAASPLAGESETAETPAVVETQRTETPEVDGGQIPGLDGAAGDKESAGSADSGRSTAGAAPRSGEAERGEAEAEVEDEAGLLETTYVYYYMADLSYGVPMNKYGFPARYSQGDDAYFKWESSDSTGDKTWGYRDSSDSGKEKWFAEQGGYYYVILPDVGRMPDLEFDGFYVLGSDDTVDWWDEGDHKTIKSWAFDESWLEGENKPVKLEKTEDGVVTADDESVDWVAYHSKKTAAEYKISAADMESLISQNIVRYSEQWYDEWEDQTEIDYRVPIVAKWKPSGKNQITKLKVKATDEDGKVASSDDEETAPSWLTLYTENPAGNPSAKTLGTVADDTFESGKNSYEFWLQVPEEQASLTLEWETFEPYYDYTVAGQGDSPVSVRAVFNGKEVTRDDGSAVTVQTGWTTSSTAAVPAPATPDGTGVVTYMTPKNGYDQNSKSVTPARAHWSVVDIPLTKVDQAEDVENDPYTTITITVDAPDGTRATYTFHVERLVTPSYTLGLGNTPLAMIEKDQRGNWGDTEAEQRTKKDAAKADFREWHKLGNPDIVGPGDYTYYKGTYDPNAWYGLTWEGQTNYNIDLDETAVVAYQDTAFVDPGVTFVGSNGRRVDASNISRTIQLRVADTLNAGLYGTDAGVDRWYAVDETTGKVSLSETKVSTPLQRSDGSDGVDLRGLKVLPGVYTITYTYQDPLTMDEVVAKRPLVVLPIPGDVNMDGAVTIQDALAIGLYKSTWESNSAKLDVRLLNYRVLGTKDATDIINGFQPTLADLGQTDYFYPPLPTPEDAGGAYTRKTWSEVREDATTGQGNAKLELRYLGLERGTLQLVDGEPAHTIADSEGRTGPWQADADGLVTLSETDANGNRMTGYQTDVFWVGVYLTAGDLAGRGIEELTLSLVYDSNYVQPAVVFDQAMYNEYGRTEEGWRHAFYYYNMGTGSKVNDVGQTLFSGVTTGKAGNYTYEDGTDWDRPYATHYSKVIGELEAIQPETASSSLKEMVISFQRTNSAKTWVNLPTEETCVLAVPFQLVKHPAGTRVSNDQARLVELGAGMRDFNLVTTAQTGTAAGVSTSDLAAQLFAVLDEPQAQTLSVGDESYAYSAQESIYGGGTHNLREKVDYATDAAGELLGLIPIGENKSKALRLTDASYAEAYTNDLANGDHTEGKLPEGLTYTKGAVDRGTLSGTPLEAGEFRFTITRTDGVETYYVLVVNKKELHFKPTPAASYYGQPEYRGESSADFAFTYTVADLAERDVPAGATLTGAGEELTEILGANYTPPTFTAKESTDTAAAAVTHKSGKGVYPILLDDGTGLDDKYLLVPEETTETAVLRIRPRPVWVDHLVADAATTGAQIYSGGSVLQQSITLTDDTGTRICLALDPDVVDRRAYGGLPLTGSAWVEGDEIQLSFRGTFQRTPEDKEKFPDSTTSFYVTHASETRAIGEIAFEKNTADNFDKFNPNYELQTLISSGEGSILSPEKNDVSGTVVRQEVTALEMTAYPAALREGDGMIYGQQVSLQDLRMKIVQNNQSADVEYDYDYNGSIAQSMDIHYNWVTKAEMEEGLLPENLNTPIGSGWNPDAEADKGEVEDAMPYDKTNEFLSVAMDGMYLCAIVRTFESGDPGDPDVRYIKCYSANPIRVSPKEVTLTLSTLNRFYGEEGALPTYTYDANALVTADLTKLHEHYGASYALTGAAEELEWLLREDENFVKPTVRFSKVPRLPTSEADEAENAITVDTDVTGTTYYQVISGAASSNYTFIYARVDTEDKRPTAEFGTAYLNILKRPIVVRDVYSMYGTEEDLKSTFATVYADSKNLLLTDQVDDGVHTAFTASADAEGIGQVVFTKPNYDEATKTLTYYNGGNSTEVRQTGMVYSGEAVRPQDRAELKVTYNVQFLPDDGHGFWNSLSQNFYDVDSLEATGGQGQRPVEIRDLTLTGAKADNYMLVYNESFHAVERAPGSAELVTAPRPTTSAGGTDDKAAFLQYGTGLVILRPIKDMTFQSVGCMSYTYGEYFAPDGVGSTGRSTVLSVHYDTRYDNYPARYEGDIYRNVNAENVPYTYENFDERGFVIHYVDVDGGQTPQEVGEDGQILAGGDPLYPQIHNGMRLFVTGRRGDADELVYSEYTSEALRIAQAPLTLTARNVHRYYGEENSAGYVIQEYYDPQDNVKPFTFTFYASQLAEWDREMLGDLLGKTVAASDILTQEQLETALSDAAKGNADQRAWAAGFGYVKPTITTAATKESPVNNRENTWGEYEITNTASSFANYQVTGEGAKLYVYPRPIRITAVKSSADDPAFTVYNKTDGTIFNTAYDQDRVTVVRSNAVTGALTVARVLANSVVSADLPLSGDALVGADRLTYQAQVQFLEKIVLEKDETDKTVDVVVTIPKTGLGSSSGEVEKNYVLVSDFVDPYAVAAIKLRTIGEIIVESVPKAKYTYGETLDLSELKVQITYLMLGDESQIAERVHVKYIDPNQFQSYGLYVNYWDTRYDTLPTADDVAARKALPNAYRKAATGDHVTIAPTHDTQRYLGNDMTDPLRRPFATNGVGLVISAFQEGENQTPIQPKIVAARSVLIEEAGVNSYELTEENTTPFTFTVSPLRLNYTVSATDKTYDGDTRTAGTLRLTNLFDRDSVQTQTYASADGSVQNPVLSTVTDVVYVPVGADYEGKGDNYTDYALTGYRVDNGAIAFTTGSYARRATGYLDKNDAVAWAQGYGWDQNLLEFTFPNANVHYEDEAFASGTPGVGTSALAAYWRASQEGNTVDGRWDSYPTVSQMPVEVRNMTFTGPDAANYTWGSSDEPQKYTTELTLDSDPAALGTGQGSLPYATVHKANRQPIQDLLAGTDFTLPTLEVDVHTNVVRLTYGEDLTRVRDLTDPAEGNGGAVRNQAGEEDYHDELHFEYALAYQDADGLLRQWAGKDGDQGYQDTRFFGGEVFLPTIDDGYVPELDQLSKIEDADDQTIYKGQRYRWSEEDTGVSDRGYREDGGFYIDPTAYPGYATYGEAVRDAYWYYDLYNTDRTGLPRDTVCYPLVRLSETHNYNPSGDLTGDADGDGQPDVSARAIYEAREAVNAYRSARGDQAETQKAAAEEKSQSVFTAAQTMADAARAQARSEVERDAAIAESSFPETEPEAAGPAGAVKTYQQRLDLLSASWERNMGGDNQEYLVEIVEDIRFTDTLRYPEQRLMNAVVYNDPTRYYAYAWDPDMSAQLRFGDPENLIDLDTQMTFAIRRRQPGGDVLDTVWTYEPEASNHTVQIYVQITGGGGQNVRSITIVPTVLFARVGDRPIQLGLVTDPAMPINRRYTWTSSDPAVATVSATGLVTIRGEGTAIITVTSANGRSDSIMVVVSEVLPVNPSSNPIFNFYYTAAWADVDSSYAFRPKDTMTRGDVVRLLDVLINPEYTPSNEREIAYVDVTGKERYYGALVRLTRAGVVKGIPGSAFAGEQLATRAEFVTMLARMLELDVSDTVGMAHAFVDAGEDATWAYAYIDAAAKAGVVQGTGGGYFAPSRNITREEAAAIIARLVVGRKDVEYKIVPTDMTPENWSYAAVLRAVNTVMTPDL